jgi:hypothetical protein
VTAPLILKGTIKKPSASPLARQNKTPLTQPDEDDHDIAWQHTNTKPKRGQMKPIKQKKYDLKQNTIKYNTYNKTKEKNQP